MRNNDHISTILANNKNLKCHSDVISYLVYFLLNLTKCIVALVFVDDIQGRHSP